MYGGGYGFGVPGYTAPGYASSMDTNPFVPGTQLNPYDADPTRPGVQLAGTSINGIPHYSSPIDTNPFVSGTQVGGMTIDGPGGFGVGVGMGGMGGMGYGGVGYGGVGGTTYTTTTTTYGTGFGPGFY